MLTETAANEHKSYRIKTPLQFNSLSRSQVALYIRISILRGLGYSFSFALSFIRSPALKIHPSNITSFGRLIFQLPDHFHCSPNAAPSHQELQLKLPPAPPRGKHARDNWHQGDPRWSVVTSDIHGTGSANVLSSTGSVVCLCEVWRAPVIIHEGLIWGLILDCSYPVPSSQTCFDKQYCTLKKKTFLFVTKYKGCTLIRRNWEEK